MKRASIGAGEACGISPVPHLSSPRAGSKRCRRRSCREFEGVPRFHFCSPPKNGGRGGDEERIAKPLARFLDSRFRGNDRTVAAGCCPEFEGVPQVLFVLVPHEWGTPGDGPPRSVQCPSQRASRSGLGPDTHLDGAAGCCRGFGGVPQLLFPFPQEWGPGG